MRDVSGAPPTSDGRRRSLVAVLLLAVAAVLVMRLALSMTTAAQEVLSLRDVDDIGIDLFVAAVCTAVVVPTVLFLRRRIDRRDLRSMGLSRAGPALRAAVGGLLVTVGAAAVVLYPATSAGALEWTPIDPVQVVYFLVTNAVIALLLEALPEEIVFRGYAYTILAESGRTVLAPVLTTALFVTMGSVAAPFDHVARALVGLPTGAFTFVPPDDDPVAYVILLTVFGAALMAVRIATGSIWPCVGMHIGFLSVNRMVLYGDRFEAGVGADLVDPDAILLFLLYIAVAALVLVVASRWRRRLRARRLRPRTARPSEVIPDA